VFDPFPNQNFTNPALKYAGDIASDGVICLYIFTKFGTDVQAILRFWLNDLRGCTVGTTMGGIYEIANEMASGGMIYVPSFIKIGSGVQTLLWGDTHTYTQTHNVTTW
jgi:hypothetical protein